jgi:hypothetical protein
MKKYLLGIVAIVTAIGFSAFTKINNKQHKTQTDYYWFQTKSSVQIADGNVVGNGDVDYLNSFGSMPPSGSGCSGLSYDCVVGFTSNQVTLSGQTPIINNNQVPFTSSKKP